MELCLLLLVKIFLCYYFFANGLYYVFSFLHYTLYGDVWYTAHAAYFYK